MHQKLFRHRSPGTPGTSDDSSWKAAEQCGGSVSPAAVTVSQSKEMPRGENLTCAGSRAGLALMLITAANAFWALYFVKVVSAPEVSTAGELSYGISVPVIHRRNLKDLLPTKNPVLSLCHGQGHLLLPQAAPSPV